MGRARGHCGAGNALLALEHELGDAAGGGLALVVLLAALALYILHGDTHGGGVAESGVGLVHAAGQVERVGGEVGLHVAALEEEGVVVAREAPQEIAREFGHFSNNNKGKPEKQARSSRFD